MKDPLSQLNELQRPRLLIRAARIGAEDYRRAPYLARLLGAEPTLRPVQALVRLMQLEADIDACRQSRDASYSVSKHVDVLSAMMGEARLVRALGGAPNQIT